MNQKTPCEKLTELGYVLKDTANIRENGQTFFYEKIVGGIRVTFAYYWDNQGGPLFMHGRLSVGANLKNVNYLSPCAHFEIDCIMFEDLCDIPEFEGILVNSYKGLNS